MTTSIKANYETVGQTKINTCRVSELNNIIRIEMYDSQNKIVSKFVEKLL